MASPSAPLASLAADKRAAVELVLRRGLSYGELANLLALPEETIRERARAGLEALAPDLPPPSRAGEIADWLLGQQAPAHAERTRTLVAADPATRRWADTVAAPLRELSGDVPDLDAELPPPRTAGERRPRPLRDASGGGGVAPRRAGGADDVIAPRSAGGGDVAAPRRAASAAGSAAAPPLPPADAAPSAGAPGRSSRLGGALLIGLALLVVGGVIAFVLTRGQDKPGDTAASPAATATATATATAGANDILLRGPAGSPAVGLMRLFEAGDHTVRFALAAQGVEPNRPGRRYSIWFRKNSGAAQLLGNVKDPVGQARTLTAAGPGNADVGRFPTWFRTSDTVLVTLDPPNARAPGKVVLSGDLPHNSQG